MVRTDFTTILAFCLVYFLITAFNSFLIQKMVFCLYRFIVEVPSLQCLWSLSMAGLDMHALLYYRAPFAVSSTWSIIHHWRWGMFTCLLYFMFSYSVVTYLSYYCCFLTDYKTSYFYRRQHVRGSYFFSIEMKWCASNFFRSYQAQKNDSLGGKRL
jgi:hypothetical protein